MELTKIHQLNNKSVSLKKHHIIEPYKTEKPSINEL